MFVNHLMSKEVTLATSESSYKAEHKRVSNSFEQTFFKKYESQVFTFVSRMLHIVYVHTLACVVLERMFPLTL